MSEETRTPNPNPTPSVDGETRDAYHELATGQPGDSRPRRICERLVHVSRALAPLVEELKSIVGNLEDGTTKGVAESSLIAMTRAKVRLQIEGEYLEKFD